MFECFTLFGVITPMQALLHLRAWQLFGILFGLPIVLEAGVMTAVLTG